MKFTTHWFMFTCLSLAVGCSFKNVDDDDDDDWDNSGGPGGSTTNGSADGLASDDGSGDTTGAGSGGTESGGSDGSTGGTGEDDGGSSPPAESCPHPYNPVHLTSWSKTYAATFISDVHGPESAVATEQGMDPGFTSTSVEAFKTWETMTVEGVSAWEGAVYHHCDYESLRGLSVTEWNMNIPYSVTVEGYPLSPDAVIMTLSTPRQYLPGTEMIGTGASWDFEYTLTHQDPTSTETPLFIITIPVSGTYTDRGLKEIEVMGETRTAWHITSTYGMGLETPTADTGTPAEPVDTGTTPTISGVPGFTRDFPGRADYYWVEGLGLVYEKHVDTETGTVVLEKTLNEVSGL